MTPRGRPEPGPSALLRELRAFGPIDMAFSATVDPRRSTFVLDRFDGARTRQLHGVISPFGVGLGGRCIAMGRPAYVTDYVNARGISHQFDAPVAGEGLRSIIAVPVTEGGVVRGVVYAGSRRSCGFGDRFVDRTVSFVRERTLNDPGCEDGVAAPSLDGSQVRELHAELRAIVATTAEPAVRRRLAALLATLSEPAAVHPDPAPSLTPRELDVLALVAVGWANGEVAARLGLTVQTTKSYLKHAMSKLGCHTRGEAVHTARRAGLLP